MNTTTTLASVTGKHSNQRLAHIQTLRAIAIIAVLVYHFTPAALPGGYIGVDVFFVISGYLIIGAIAREIDTTGRVNLIDFWARRARRLLPASLLVLVATGLTVLAVAPRLLWRDWFAQLGASGIYVQNWFLVSQGTDYSAAEATVSPFQHYWSLSTEEQFYIIAPLLLAGIALVTRSKRTLLTALALMVGVSLVWSIITVNDSASYFSTLTRVWEFASGGLLAVAAVKVRARGGIRHIIQWGAVSVIVATALLFNDTTPFPGAAAAIPVAATLLLLQFGVPRILEARPVVWVGDNSYALYLWHWPVVVLLPYMVDVTPAVTVAAVAACVLLSWLTRLLVEDPIRLHALARRPAWVSLTAMAAGTALVLAGCSAVYVDAGKQIEERREATVAAVAGPDACVGARAISNDCSDPYAVTDLTDPASAQVDLAATTTYQGCQQVRLETAVIECVIGDVTDPVRTVALVGDSHITQFMDGFNAYGLTHSWRFLVYTKSYCPGLGTDGAFNADPGAPGDATDCAVWGQAVLDKVAGDDTVSAVVFSNFTRRYVAGNPHDVGRPLTAQDVSAAWVPLLAAGKQVVTIRDLPSNPAGVGAPACVAEHLGDYDPCAIGLADAVWPASQDPMIAAAHELDVPVLDFQSLFCTDRCHVVIGGLIAYFDSNHMTTSFSVSAAEVFGGALAERLG